MAFGQSFPFVIQHERAMVKLRRRMAKGAIQEQLAGGGFEQVLPTDNFSDAHGVVIDNRGKLIGWYIIVTPNHEITKVFPRNQSLRPTLSVNKRNVFGVRDAETPVNTIVRCCRTGAALGSRAAECFRTTRAWINRFVFSRVGRLECPLHVLTRTGAWIDAALGAQMFESFIVDGQPLALRVWTKRTPNVRAFLPSKAEPLEILKERRDELRPAPVVIQIFIAQHQRASV